MCVKLHGRSGWLTVGLDRRRLGFGLVKQRSWIAAHPDEVLVDTGDR